MVIIEIKINFTLAHKNMTLQRKPLKVHLSNTTVICVGAIWLQDNAVTYFLMQLKEQWTII